MSVDEVLAETPIWFKRLIMPMIFILIVAVPAVLGGANEINRRVIIERDLVVLQEIINGLQKRDIDTQTTVQRYEVKQAVMDSKLDSILKWIEKQE